MASAIVRLKMVSMLLVALLVCVCVFFVLDPCFVMLFLVSFLDLQTSCCIAVL